MTISIVRGQGGRGATPEVLEAHAAAVERAGGVLVPLGEATRGLIWGGGAGAELAALIDAHPAISWVQLPLAGIDPYRVALDRPVRFTSAKGVFGEPVAEHALALTLALLRSLPARAQARSWGTPRATSLYDARVVIVGAGGITQELIRLLAPFRARIVVARRTADPVDGAETTTTLEGLGAHLGDADVVVLASALTPQTRGLVDAAFLARLPRRAVLVNIARGEIVDTAALVDALSEGRIAGAGLDVVDPEPLPDGHPLWGREDVLITPHTANTAEMMLHLLGARIEENVRAFLAGDELQGVVDPDAGY